MPAEFLLRALRHVWLALIPLDVPMAVISGLAMAVWKHVRATNDVDLLLTVGERDSERITEVLLAAGPPSETRVATRLAGAIGTSPNALRTAGCVYGFSS